MNLVLISEIHCLSKYTSNIAKNNFSNVNTTVIDEYYYNSTTDKIEYKHKKSIYDNIYFVKINEFYTKTIESYLFSSDNIIFNYKPYSYNKTFLKDYLIDINENNIINYLLNLLTLVKLINKHKNKLKKYLHISNLYYSNNKYFSVEDTDLQLMYLLSNKFKEINLLFIPYIYNSNIDDRFSKVNNIFYIIDNIISHSTGTVKIPFCYNDYVEILHLSDYLEIIKYLLDNIDNINSNLFIRGEIIYIKDIVDYIIKYKKIKNIEVLYSPVEETVLKNTKLKDIQSISNNIEILKYKKQYNFIYMIEEYLKKSKKYEN